MEAPVLDFHKAKDNPILVHPEEDWISKVPVGADNKRNLCASNVEEKGDVDAVLSSCKYTVERTYRTKANQQTMMETFRACCYKDYFGRLNVISSTQIPFHVKRILGNALDIPASKIRVIKPRLVAVSEQNRRLYVKFIRQLSHGKQVALPRLSILVMSP